MTAEAAALAEAALAFAGRDDVTSAQRCGAVALNVALTATGSVEGARAALGGFRSGGGAGLELLKQLTDGDAAERIA
jgi:hypothetical protein